MRLKVLYHGNCFDGCSSAALFGRYFAERQDGERPGVEYFPLAHQQGDPFPPGAFDGDVNACVDFRYSASPKLHWWFDHHSSAFQAPNERASFDGDRSGQKFWDSKAPSCTGFMARVLRERFGWEAPDLAELIRWADIIDAARFTTAAMAVRLVEPALRIMTLLEATQEPAIPTRIIEALQKEPLERIADEKWVHERLDPILERHFRSIDTVRSRAQVEGDVVFIDLSDSGFEGANKFIAYDLFPDARYTVVISHDPRKSKVSVGSNPWSRSPRTHDISRLCEKYGGGGHAVVGAVSLGPDDLARARQIAREIADALKVG